jgi:hypothetical protein
MMSFLKKYPMLLLIAGLGLLIYTQQKIVMPFVYKVVSSDLFLVESKDRGSRIAISTPLTDLAFKHCNTYIKSEIGDAPVKLAEKPINVWSLGGYQFVVNGEITNNKNAAAPVLQKYVCRITYSNGDNTDGVNEFANWNIDGLSDLKLD